MRRNDRAVLYLLSSLLAGVGAHLAYRKLLLKHTSWSYSPYGDLEMQAGEPGEGPGAGGGGKGAPPGGVVGSDGAAEGDGDAAPPNFSRIPAVERMLLVFLYSIASAVVGTQSVLMAKCTSQIMRLQLGGESQWGSPFAMYILTVFGLTAGFWMMRLNRGLRLFPSTFIVPMMQAMWTVLSILNGGIFFKEFENFDGQRTVVFFSGVLVVLLSVLSLASGKAGGGGDGSCNGQGDPERDGLLGGSGAGGRTRSRSSSGGSSGVQSGGGSFIFSLPCVPFLMSAQAVDLEYEGDSDANRWEALNRERREASRTLADDESNICTLNAHGQYGFPGRHRRPNSDSSGNGSGNSTATSPKVDGAAGSTSTSSGGGGGGGDRGGGMLSWAWRVVESPRRRPKADKPAEPDQQQSEADDFFKAEGAV